MNKKDPRITATPLMLAYAVRPAPGNVLASAVGGADILVTVRCIARELDSCRHERLASLRAATAPCPKYQ
jgi:hypothetical protein